MKERASPDWKPPPPAVVELKTDDFDEFINKQDIALVEFYAPWQNLCVNADKTYRQGPKYTVVRSSDILEFYTSLLATT